MSAAGLLNVPPMRDEDCPACQLVAHGIHCQRVNRDGERCACSCRARLAWFNCLTVALGSSESPAPRVPRSGEPNGVVRPQQTAAARPTTPPIL